MPDQVKASRPELPWVSIAGLRNVFVHEYFRVDPGLIRDIVDNELDALANAIPDQMRPGMAGGRDGNRKQSGAIEHGPPAEAGFRAPA